MEPWIVLGAAAVVAVAVLIALLVWRRRRARALEAGGAPAVEAVGTGERLRRGLAATRERLVAQLDGVLRRGPRSLDAIVDDLEEVLIGADVGVSTTGALLEPLRSLGGDASPAAVRGALAGSMRTLLEAPPAPAPSSAPWV